MLALLILSITCIIFGRNLRPEFVYAVIFAVSFPMWLMFSATPVLAIVLITAQAMATWCIVECAITYTQRGFKLYWRLGGIQLAIALA